MNGKKARALRKELSEQGKYYDQTEYEVINPAKDIRHSGTIGLTKKCGRKLYKEKKQGK